MGLDKNMLGAGGIYRKFTIYPRCTIFNCVKLRGVSYKCCFFCEKKDKCHDPCQNDPQECGKCVIPDEYIAEMKEGNKVVWELGDMNLPDAPDIAYAERTGKKRNEREPEDEEYLCPICGNRKPCDTVYLDRYGNVVGCNRCIQRIEADEYMEIERGKE